jgi:hypothetical protein
MLSLLFVFLSFSSNDSTQYNQSSHHQAERLHVPGKGQGRDDALQPPPGTKTSNFSYRPPSPNSSCISQSPPSAQSLVAVCATCSAVLAHPCFVAPTTGAAVSA